MEFYICYYTKQNVDGGLVCTGIGISVMLFFTRRALFGFIPTLLLSNVVDAVPSVAALSRSREGRINLGLKGITYYSPFYPFLNVWKCGAHLQVTANRKNYWSDIPPGAKDSPWNQFLDPNGELVKPLPAGTSHLRRIFYSPPIDGIPEGFNRVGQRWILKWDGTATKVSVAGSPITSRGRNRIVWTWGSNTRKIWVAFAGMAHDNPPRNIRLCEARYEPRLDAGEIFNPEWLSIVREGSGIVRFMDWQWTNLNRSTLYFSDIPTEKYYSFGGKTTTPFVKGGMPLPVMSTLAKEVHSHPWVCIPSVLGTRNLSAITTIQNSNPAVVSSPGHKWRDGDQIIPYRTNWSKIEKNTYTVANSDRRAGVLTLLGVDSTSFGPYKVKWASLTAPYDLESIEAELAPLAGHFRDRIANGLVTFFEFGNETWNWIFDGTHWLAAQSRAKFGRDDSNAMAGYLGAHCMKVIRDVYGIKNRNRWRGVLATQTVNPQVTKRRISGAIQYIREHAPSLMLNDLFNDLAIAGYFGGWMFKPKNKAMVDGWMDESESRSGAGLEPNKYSFFNRVVNEKLSREINRYPVNVWASQKTIADAHGLTLIQYEGGNGNKPGFFSVLTKAERVRFMEFYKHCNHTPEDAQNYTAIFNEFIAFGGKYPAKFVEMGAVGRYGAWGGLRYLGDKNPVWDAVVKFNGRT